ncbi:hypothetical protein FHJ31_16940 [Pseudomonas sp. Fig-3]|nr:hypothetical protein FHJ31_16940 [Pseudomonas sp. Fig-3]
MVEPHAPPAYASAGLPRKREVRPRSNTSPVGASLLAIAEGQLAGMLNVPPSSRASSLPQFFGPCADAVFA